MGVLAPCLHMFNLVACSRIISFHVCAKLPSNIVLAVNSSWRTIVTTKVPCWNNIHPATWPQPPTQLRWWHRAAQELHKRREIQVQEWMPSQSITITRDVLMPALATPSAPHSGRPLPSFYTIIQWLKDQTLPGNYRPISLLSIFYTLTSCFITHRIKPSSRSLAKNRRLTRLKT